MTGRLTPFLVALARDPELYAAWIRQPEAVMVWVGLDAEERAVLHSRDQDRIYQALFRPPSAAAAPPWPIDGGVPSSASAAGTAVYWGSYAYPPVTVTLPMTPAPPSSPSAPCA